MHIAMKNTICVLIKEIKIHLLRLITLFTGITKFPIETMFSINLLILKYRIITFMNTV